MTMLTTEELREPDVIIEIPYEKWDKLPRATTEWLRLFGKRDTGSMYVLRLPAYRYRELVAEVQP